MSTDDIGFSAAILDDIESRYCVDTNRIYATGKSQGGGFVGVLACDDSLSKRVGKSFPTTDRPCPSTQRFVSLRTRPWSSLMSLRFGQTASISSGLHVLLLITYFTAAFAPVSGAFYVNTTGGSCNPNTIIYNPAVEPAKNCTPGRAKIPVLEFHGLVDGTIAYEGGVRRKACLPAIPHWIQGWAEYDDLGETNVSSKVPGATDGSTAVRYEFGKDGEQGLVTHIMDGNVSLTTINYACCAVGMRRKSLTTLCRILGTTGRPRCLTTTLCVKATRRRLSTHRR